MYCAVKACLHAIKVSPCVRISLIHHRHLLMDPLARSIKNKITSYATDLSISICERIKKCCGTHAHRMCVCVHSRSLLELNQKAMQTCFQSLKPLTQKRKRSSTGLCELMHSCLSRHQF